jgi:uncharacterized protein YcnI
MKRKTTPALLLASLLSGPSLAHVTLSPASAMADSYVKVVLSVPHGCAGTPTRALTVHLPAGFLVAKPQPKPGWTTVIQKEPLTPPIELHGRPVAETARVVRWEGGSLPNDHFDEFALQGRLAANARGSLIFRVVQTCERGESDWNGAPGSATPAPRLEVQPPAAGGHHHH